MRRYALALIALSLLARAVPAEEPAPRDPVAGTWHLFLEFRGQEVLSSITIRRLEGGGLAGTYEDETGVRGAVEEISFRDGVLRFRRTRRQRVVWFEGRVKGDLLEGHHAMGPQRIAARGARGEAAFEQLMAAHRKANERGADLEADYDRHARRQMPRDGFPVLFDPEMTPAAEARLIRDEEPVLGIAAGGEAKAYPISILGVHELVNDTIGGRPIAASW